MAAYSGSEAHPEVWRAVAEHRGRKELRKTDPAPADPRLTPKSKAEKFPHN